MKARAAECKRLLEQLLERWEWGALRNSTLQNQQQELREKNKELSRRLERAQGDAKVLSKRLAQANATIKELQQQQRKRPLLSPRDNDDDMKRLRHENAELAAQLRTSQEQKFSLFPLEMAVEVEESIIRLVNDFYIRKCRERAPLQMHGNHSMRDLAFYINQVRDRVINGDGAPPVDQSTPGLIVPRDGW